MNRIPVGFDSELVSEKMRDAFLKVIIRIWERNTINKVYIKFTKYRVFIKYIFSS